MAFDEKLSQRISDILHQKKVPFENKKMFGGMCFLVDDKMCIGINEDKLMARIHPEEYEKLLQLKGAGPMDFTKKPMKGFLYIQPEGYAKKNDLQKWIDRCLEYNPIAKSSKKK